MTEPWDASPADDTPRTRIDRTVSAAARDEELEDLVAEFVLRREEGEELSVEEYIAAYPAYAEDLAKLLHLETVPFESSGGPAPLGRLTIGPYKVEEHVASGGGGSVYRARHLSSGQLVALKVLDQAVIADPRNLERFEREAETLRSLDLVGVIPVYDRGEDRGRIYFAMKWIEGDTLANLRDRLQEKDSLLHRLRDRVRLVASLARTLELVHREGILHRDIKPQNLLVDRSGQPVIIDFGIAFDATAAELTRQGEGPLGTPRYLPPELLSEGRRRADVRSEVYGLGLCLYELLVGSRAFFQNERGALERQIARVGILRPRAVDPTLPLELEAIALRACHLDPGQRHETMAALADDLEAWLDGRAIHPRTRQVTKGWRLALVRRRRELRVAAALLVVAVLGALAWWGWGRVLEQRQDEEARRLVLSYAFAPRELRAHAPATLDAAVLRLSSRAGDDQELALALAWDSVSRNRPNAGVAFLEEAPDRSTPVWKLLHEATTRMADTYEKWSGDGAQHYVDFKGEDSGHYDMKEVKPLNSTGAELRRFRILRPLPLDTTLELLDTRAPTTADERRACAALLWDALPTDPAPKEARRLLKRLLTPERESPPGAWSRYAVAMLQLRLGEVTAARGRLEALRQHHPGHPVLAFAVGLARFREDPKSAIEDLRRAGSLVRESKGPLAAAINAWTALALIEASRPKEAEACIVAWESALEGSTRWQDRVFPLLARARIEREQENLEQALEFVVRARKLNSNFALPLREEAELLSELDREGEARAKAAFGERSPIKRPESIEAFLGFQWFGLRPFANFHAVDAAPTPQGR